jgi:hypothetical protein
MGVASFGNIRLQETADNAYGAVVNSSILIGYQRQDGQDGEAQTIVTATNEEGFNVIVIALQASASRNASN